MAESSTRLNEPIAIIGSGCRFPGGASSTSKLWELLQNPRDLTQKIPKDRFNVDAFYDPDGSFHGRTNAQYGYFLDEDPYAFDPSFFNIPPTEAETIDPQQRLLLETVYDSITSAGLRLEDLKGSSTAVYVGLMQRDFLDSQNYDLDALNTYAATGTAASILSNRVSYVFDWHGPSMTIDTACSSSLVAVHHAVGQLRTGLSKVAVAAGSNLMLGPVPFISASKLNMFSPQGRSRMWDVGADGYARGEGVAAIVMKTLSQAIADNDTIDCVIRESGINQDGKTPGITMPSASAQEALIRQVYEAAGLDVNKPEDRCQYFEAHGTGTPAGDPKEAEAISQAFFGQRKRSEEEDPLYVGSIKTIIGHTEGTAGIAGVMKASHLIQHGVLVPNMLLNELAPQVAPFCADLEVVTKPREWPALKYNQPRRVSVNSFGFGGTNAHVILEAYVCPTARVSSDVSTPTPPFPCLAPITLSANSEASLKATLEDLRRCLTKAQPALQLRDLAWTLLKKRSSFHVRHTIQAKTLDDLCDTLQRDVSLIQGRQSIVTASSLTTSPQILGIFTGQGAQWPAMGKTLITQVPFARSIVEELDQSLHELPAEYRPSWKLLDQLMLEGESSNVHSATYSQPLCCAVQVILTRLLQASGVEFKVVVGHSSGEIAAAFAAGFVSACQAIRIAYLRGLTSKHAGSDSGKEGAMMAAGTSFEDATELCSLEIFHGRISVAASNAPESTTISGDRDAILEAQEILQDEGKFNRLLKIDKAYHSDHMRPCAEPYINALRACGCDTFNQVSPSSSTWISSVFEGKEMRSEDLNAKYWADNLLSPVLFSFAVEQAVIKHTPLDIAIEVGAHPALKNPSIQTVENCVGSPIPYVGCMERSKDDVNSFSCCLGFLWSNFGSAAFDVDSLYRSLSLDQSVQDLSRVLPTYSWDHSRTYRKESRALRCWLGAERPHLLLGRQLAHSSPSLVQWQNFLKQSDIEWLNGHSLQGQTVFPGAGYIVMAMEAALKLSDDREVRLLEVLDLSIDKAVTFEDESSMVELNLTLAVDVEQTTECCNVYQFVINSCLARETGLSPSAAGLVVITYGPGGPAALPDPQAEPPHLNKVSIDRFYNMLEQIGYGYQKQFRGVSSLRRGDSKACGTINYHRLRDGHRNMVIHPATLDVAFQSFIGAYTAPGDRRLRSLLVPTGINRIALNPWVSDRIHVLSTSVNFTSTSAASIGNTVEGDIEVYDADSSANLLQVEGLSFKPFSPPSAADDHEMFSKWDWAPLYPDALLDSPKFHATTQDIEDVKVIERITYWYIRFFLDGVTAKDREEASFTFTKQIQWCEHMVKEAKAGHNVWHEPDWESDSRVKIDEMIRENVSHPFVRLTQRVGEGAVETLRANRNPFDLMDHDGLLSEFYGGTVSYGHSYNYYQTMLEQINHRFQNLDVLEIGAGTGGASRYFLNDDNISFNSYTFTDISGAFFEQAAKEFERHADKMDFRPLDVRRDPTEQDFKAHSYDLVIASNVLHATPELETTLKNVHKLLKPGGRLIVIEVAHREHTRIGFIFGLFTDWWAGHDEGRILEPFISYDQWDVVLRKAGFSGVDGRTLDPDSRIFPNGVFHTHAVNDLVERLDSPLTVAPSVPHAPLVIVGGSSPRTNRIAEGLSGVMPSRNAGRISSIKDIIDLDYNPGSTFVVLSELDKDTFSELDDEQIDALQTLFNIAHNILWVTEDAWAKNPRQAMSIGFLRTLRMEYPDVAIQVVDVDKTEELTPEFLMETVLRLEYSWDCQDSGVLSTQEPELFVKDGKVIVPRLKPDVARNNRLNAIRRPVMINGSPAREILSFEHDGEEPYFKLLEDRFVFSHVDKSLVKIQVQHSLAKALRVGPLGYLHLVQGKIAGSQPNEIVLALSEINSSSVQVSADQVVTISNDNKISFLSAVAADLAAQTMVANLVAGSTLLIYSPPKSYLEALAHRSLDCGITLTCISRHAAPTSALGGQIAWIQLHEKETQRGLRQKLPRNASVFYDLSEDKDPTGLNNRLIRCLPASCSLRRVDHLFQHVAAVSSAISVEKLQSMLAESVSAAGRLSINQATIPVLEGQDLVSPDRTIGIDTIIDWKPEQVIPSRVRSIETDQTFLETRTYLLVGLAGDLGRSIARFMVEHGARHIVLTSRSPNVDQRWIDDITQIGGNIMVLAMDVSNEASVDAGLAQVRESMPPVGGVAFGPLVLQDVMFKNMDLSMLEMVLAPKVTGARLLDERLSDPLNPLDFFVMFSSFVMVSGNPGQAAYSAANAYTHALAQQRRARGLAASTIDIGAVFGVGFIARAGREHEYDVVKFIFDEVNEWELHALFAEAVVAGRNKDITDVEIITGMPYMDPINHDRIPYFNDPRFAFFKLSDRKTKGDDTGDGNGSVKDRLLTADGLEKVHEIIIDGLSGKIRGALQLTSADQLSLTTPLIDQGVDSLSAVTVSSWFTKNLGIEIPLLKILGGASVNDLVEEAVSRLTPDAIPLAYPEGSGDGVRLAASGAGSGALSSDYDSKGPEMDSSLDFDDPSTPTSLETGEEVEYTEKEAPLSITQEYSWKQQQLSLDPKTFNSTIGMYMQGPLNLSRLAWAFNQALQRHDAFRTCFIPNSDGSDIPMQFIMKTPLAKFEAFPVADKAAADQAFKELEEYEFRLDIGDTLKIVDYYWSSTDHLLIIAYHRLVGDGWTTEHLFVEAGQLYGGVKPEVAPSYADFAIRQRKQLASGEWDQDLEYWNSLFQSPPSRLKLLNVPGAKTTSLAPSWTEHEGSSRLNRMIAIRIKDRSRKHKATPMHYYLAAFHVLLARLTGSTDIIIGVADTNRPTLADQSTMGYFFNLLPIRLGYTPDSIFNEVLSSAKEKMRLSMVHGSVPYGAILDHLGLGALSDSDAASHAPLFQAVFDYKQGQAESGSIGEATIVDSRTPRAGSPYDITLEMSDDPTKDPLITVKLQASRYGPDDVRIVLDAYLSILSIFSRNPALRVEDGSLTQGSKASA